MDIYINMDILEAARAAADRRSRGYDECDRRRGEPQVAIRTKKADDESPKGSTATVDSQSLRQRPEILMLF